MEIIIINSPLLKQKCIVCKVANAEIANFSLSAEMQAKVH